jgi:glutathione S-transferase
VGKKLSYTDLNIASFLQIFSESHEGLLTPYPKVKAHQDTVFNTPGIKEWVEKRPKTQW